MEPLVSDEQIEIIVKDYEEDQIKKQAELGK